MKRERVLVLSGPMKGAEVQILGSLTIGRSPENGLQLNDLQISRKHAVIQQTPSGTIIRDLGSGNGTIIGNQRIREHRLSSGDVFTIGPVELQYVCMDEEASEIAPELSSVRFHAEEDATVRTADADSVYKTFLGAPTTAKGPAQIVAAQNRLAAVYQANQMFASERDLTKLFGKFMDQVFALVPAHNGVILLRDKATGEPVASYVKSVKGQTQVTVSSSIVRKALAEGRAVITSNAAADFEVGASIIAQNIASAMCTPLKHQDETLGVVYVDTRGAMHAFKEADLELLVALAAPAAIAIKNAQYVDELERSYQDTLVGLANAIELRDHYTVGHTWRVTNFAVEIARTLGWTEEKLKECEIGGVLHDIGKLTVPDSILRKPTALDEEERAKMQAHPAAGARLMQDILRLVPVIPYALYHHERYDGEGYPFGLEGENVPIEGRLIAVADTLDAMTSNRPYRKGMDPDVAIAKIQEVRGTQLDPVCVDALMAVYRQGKVHGILQEFRKGGQSIACPFCSTYIEVPKGAQLGDTFHCTVCRRRVQLRVQNEAYFGELVAAVDVGRPTPL